MVQPFEVLGSCHPSSNFIVPFFAQYIFHVLLCGLFGAWLETKSTKCSLFQTLSEPSVKRKSLRALTLVGPTWNNQLLDPLAALHLDN